MRTLVSFLLLYSLFESNYCSAQGYLKITMQHPTDSAAMNGSVNYSLVGITQPAHYETYMAVSDTNGIGSYVFVGTGDQLNNLGTGGYFLIGALGSHAIQHTLDSLGTVPSIDITSCFPTNDIVGEFTLGSMYLTYMDTNTVIAPGYLTNPTSNGVCDGKIDYRKPGIGATTYATQFITPSTSWTNTDNIQLLIDSVGGIGYYQIPFLCVGKGAMEFLGIGGEVCAFTFFTGNEFDVFPYISSSASVNPVSVGGQCDGSIKLNVIGGIPPYTWYVDSVPQVSNIFYNQCEGRHSYFVTDSAGISSKTQNVVVGNQNSYYVTPNLYGGPVVDSVYLDYQNCNYDYNVPADSAFLDSLIPLNPPHKYIAFFHVWQQGQLIDVIDTLVLDSVGVNQVNLTMYCDTVHRSVQGTLTIVCYVNTGNALPLAIFQLQSGADKFKLFPNPASEYATVQLTSATAENVNLSLTDVTGQVLQQFTNINANSININLQRLPAGVYTLTLRSSQQVQSKQLIKF